MVLRRKPDALSNVLPTCPTLREKPEYQGQDKLPVIVWMMAQVCLFVSLCELGPKVTEIVICIVMFCEMWNKTLDTCVFSMCIYF